MTVLNKLFFAVVSLPFCFASTATMAQDSNTMIKLQFPINCTLDHDCFLQQFTDMDESQKVIDPFCGGASYDGHKGTDIRLRTLRDIDNNIEVLAAASGTIKGIRKNKPDRLVISDSDQEAVKGVECGNGVVIDHGNHIQTQYCHLKQNSPTWSVGDKIKAGEILGFVGASGLAQFPHLHITVRKNGKVIDPFTGNTQSQGCDNNTDKSWWTDNSILTADRDAILLDSNLTGAPIEHKTMVLKPPLIATTGDAATVGWVWYSNLKKNDRVYINLQGPNGLDVDTLSEPMNRNKASWSGYVGKRKKPQLGEYKITTYILRDGETGSVEKRSRHEKMVVVKK